MKHLVYCVLRDAQAARGVVAVGVEGSRVSLMAEDGLAAAFSLVPEMCLAPSVSRAAAYARVVQVFHETATVLPFRYGCFLEDAGAVVELLRARRREFRESLEELDGCVEMGVRVLLSGRDSGTCRKAAHAPNLSSGKAYLADRKTHYVRKDGDDEESVAATERVRQAFKELVVKSEAETSCTDGRRLVSVFFLVPRGNVGRFHTTFRQLQSAGCCAGRSPQGMLVTGPWPPYSFACRDSVQRPHGVSAP
ncbi:MAG: GvpL/GvpF family gas vesicle protein [Planctomycetota bacterium]|nr:GvpL/GvpF family gas vesicle protein [Planctomycetota bacterium]